MTKKWNVIFLVGIIFLLLTLLVWYIIPRLIPKNSIKIGILHSLTGNLAISERPVANATQLAIEEINKAGGILGRKIEAIVVDGKSDENIFATEAQRLIEQEKVVAIFGCWTSPSRIKVKNVVEKYDSLLFYPVQFEGLEDSPCIAYTSTVPNQQMIPGIRWCMKHLGKKFFLVGSDQILHEIIKDVVAVYDGTVVGEKYFAQDDKNIEPVVQAIIDAQPDVILNNIEGENNLLFFTELRKRGITPEKVATMSFSISEPELQLFNVDVMTGDYATWSYFESITNHENNEFYNRFIAMYGENNTVSDAMEAAYFGVYLWKQAVEKAQSVSPKDVRPALHNQAFDAPQGLIHIAQNSLHTWSFARVGKIRSDKQFTVLWSSEKSIQPVAYPVSRSVAEWDNLRKKIMEQEG